MATSNDTLDLSVVAVNQPIGTFFVASISARDLVRISYVDVRRLVKEEREIETYLGIQRPLNRTRVKEIRKYLMGRDATFPTAVILAIDERCAEFQPVKRADSGQLRLSGHVAKKGDEDEDIPFERIAAVIDGQHRIAAFMNDEYEYEYPGGERTFDVNVAIIVGADISEQANIFATVNLAQTKVNKSLVYDLTELAETRSPQKTCHNVAVALDTEPSSPFYARIKRLGVATPGRTYEPLTQAGFVESLLRFVSRDAVGDRQALLDGDELDVATANELEHVPFRNMFIEGRDLEIAEIIYNFFVAVRKKWPKSWDAPKESRNLLPRMNAFRALMRFLRQNVYPELVEGDYGRIPTAKQFQKYFDPIEVKDEDFRSQVFSPGSSGESTFLKMLRREIRLEDMIEK